MAQNNEGIQLATITTGGRGTQSISVGGGANSIPNVSSNQNYNEGQAVAIFWVNEDTPVIIGRGGYSRA